MTETTPDTIDLAAPVAANADVQLRIGLAWRELRRGASAAKLRELFYTEDGCLLDQTLADALLVIAQQGPIRMGELAEALRITPASATRAARCLENRGLIHRTRGRSDQRSVHVEATKVGLERSAVISSKILNALEHTLDNFSIDEQCQLADLFERFVTALDRVVDDENLRSS